MSRQQLFINDVAVDMPQDEIKIKVESNILSDADKVKTAHSYNIALPRTATNDRVMLLAYLPSAETGGTSTHTYLNASLYVDGVPLFNAGRAVLTSVDDNGYNLNLYWGLVDAFDEIKREGLKLCDLPMSAHWTSEDDNDWSVLAQYPISMWDYNSGMDSTVYNELNAESKTLVDALPWVLPVTSARDILAKVQSVYGITFDYSATFAERLDKLWHPLTTLRTMCEDEVLTFRVGSGNSIYNGKNFLTWLPTPTNINNTHAMSNAIEVLNRTPFSSYSAHRELAVKKVRVYGTCNKDFRVIFADAPQGDRQIEATQVTSTQYTIDKTWEDVKVTEAWDLPDIVQVQDPQTGASTPFITDIRMDVEIGDIGDAKRGDQWSYVRNYPRIKVLDYISEVLAHCGAFIVGSVTTPDALRFVTFDEVATAEPRELKMLQGVTSINMALDDVARRNIYTHESNDDDGLEYLADGVIYSGDATLELEREAFKSHFKVPRSNMVRLFDVEIDDNGAKKASWNSNAGDYIGGYAPYSDGSAIYFCNTGQDFVATIASYYRSYEAVVQYPKQVEVVAHMGILELMAVDFTLPIYIAQLGRAYLIESIESDNGDNYKLTLIQL